MKPRLTAVAGVMWCLSMIPMACDDETSGRGHSGGDAAAGQFDGLLSDVLDGRPLSDAAEAGLVSALDGRAADAFCIDPASISDANASELQSRVLYTNDFEAPNEPLAVDCPHALDARGINFLYGTPAFQFNQVNTVEGVIINDPSKLYKNPTGQGGKFALGMLSTLQDDRLSLTFEVTGKPFLNVGLDLSAIDVNGCGGPFGVARPGMKVSLYETATGLHNFSTPGKLLDEGMITGDAPADPWTFAWKYGVVSLNASQATTARVSVVFDLLQSGYAAFDNLSIVASAKAGVVDQNNDGIPDDAPVCGRTIRVCDWNPSTMDFDTNCTFVDAGQ